MKVLMVWDQGINYLLMRELKSLGVETRMIASDEWDPFNMIDPQWKRNYRGHSKLRLVWDILRESSWPDVVHVHSFDKSVPALKALGRRVVLHYHGTDIRGRWEKKKWLWRGADRIIVSTRNLLEGAPPGVELVKNPIDVDLFKPLDYVSPTYGALYINYGAVDLAEKIAAEHGLHLTVVEKGTPYKEMPVLLNRFTHYVDVKRDAQGRLLMGKPTDTGSLVGLEALACGCRVLTLWGERLELPSEHRPENVAKQIKAVYDSVLSGKKPTLEYLAQVNGEVKC